MTTWLCNESLSLGAVELISAKADYVFTLGAVQTLLTSTQKILFAESKCHSQLEELVCSRSPSQLRIIWGWLERHTTPTCKKKTKCIKSTMGIGGEKSMCLLFLSLNCTQCLAVMASPCYAECSHTLMNAAIYMHKQLLRVYQSKLLYLESTRPQQWLGFLNEPLSIEVIITSWMSVCCIALLNNLNMNLRLIENIRIPSQVAWWTHSWVIVVVNSWIFLMFQKWCTWEYWGL